MHAVALIGGNTFLFALQPKCHREVGQGASQAVLTLQAPLTPVRGLPHPGTHRDSSALVTEAFFSFIHSVNTQ